MIFRNFCIRLKKIHWTVLETYSRRYSQHKILFFGTDNFSLPSLKLITKKNSIYSRLEVVTSFKSKKNPIKDYANLKKLPLHDWEVIKNEQQNFCCEFDIGLVVSFGHLIPESIIKCFINGMLNVHASLLPKYRGASPIIYAIKNHEKITGVSIMKVMPGKFDIGNVLATQEVSIGEQTLMPELHDNLANIGAELLVKCLKNLDSSIANSRPQDDTQASYAPKIDKDFCKVRWNNMSAQEIYDLFRALYSYKHIQTTFRNETVKLLEVKISSENICWNTEEQIAGQIKFFRKTGKKKLLLVYARDGSYLEIEKLLIGKKTMTPSDFFNGFLSNLKVGERRFE